MNVMDAIRNRRSVRAYDPRLIPDEVMQRMRDALRLAPSACNNQPWAFVLVTDAQLKADLGKASRGQMFIAEAPVVIVPCADRARSRSRYGDEGDRYAVIDTAFSSLLLLLAVVEEGLGACFVGAFYEEQVSKILDLPEPVRPLAVVPVGVPAEKPGRLALRPLESVLHFGRW